MNGLHVGGLAIIIYDAHCPENVGSCVVLRKHLGTLHAGKTFRLGEMLYIPTENGDAWLVEKVEGTLSILVHIPFLLTHRKEVRQIPQSAIFGKYLMPLDGKSDTIDGDWVDEAFQKMNNLIDNVFERV